ncbi:lambda-exonuclease family protein [Thermomonas mangrovi]|uniref:lambda-exonuclease family protein n=1 Tax=Thermomonas mangrovi TaxID=2993316 RepID=UPI002306F4A5|nr:YqaJ viral recombinase family protein [Thermomonas mangrovi]
MKILNLQQGSPEWLAHRRTVRNASEAPAMMGASPYVTRAELIRRKATGIEREIDAATQRVFDKGHQVEPALRALAEKIIGEDLYPVTAVSDDGYLGASFDGVTMSEDTFIEAKQPNAEKMAQVRAGILPEADQWQVVQQFAVCTSADMCLYLCGDGTEEGTAILHVHRDELFDAIHRLRAGWAQFDDDVAAYQPEPEVLPPATGAHVEGFGLLTLRVEGRVLASNLDSFRAGAEAFLARLPKPDSLQTDQDFADADTAVKACAEAESRIKAAKDAALAQMADVEAVMRTADSVSESIRQARLALDKLVKARKESIKAEIVAAGCAAVRAHYDAINATLGAHAFQPPQTLQLTIGAAIKGMRSIKAMRDAVDAAVAAEKIEASQSAERIRACISVLDQHAEHRHLFADAVQLCARLTPDVVDGVVKGRIAEHQRREAERLEAERERIRMEEADRLERERRESERAEAPPPAPAPAPAPAPVVAQPAANTPVSAAPARTHKAPTASRPMDREIIDVLALHFRVHDSKVIEWLADMDLDQASRELLEAM